MSLYLWATVRCTTVLSPVRYYAHFKKVLKNITYLLRCFIPFLFHTIKISPTIQPQSHSQNLFCVLFILDLGSPGVPERDAFVHDAEPRRPLDPAPPPRPQRGRRPQPARDVARAEVPARPVHPRPQRRRSATVSGIETWLQCEMIQLSNLYYS